MLMLLPIPSQLFVFFTITTHLLCLGNGHAVPGDDTSRGSFISLNLRNSLNDLDVRRSDFASDFVFGAATSAVQTEGSGREYGKGKSIVDSYAEKFPGKIKDGSSPEIAIDSYVRYKEDVKLLKQLGVDAYRFSIPWTRILPRGSLRGGVNQQGINHYSDLIDELLDNGIKPFATLFHFDSPQVLQDKYGGFLSRKIVDDFRDFAEICFKTYGARVKNWITINEPLIISQFGYDSGLAAPGRCSYPPNVCTAGNSSTEPYIVTHNVLLAHAAAVKLYREKFQAEQKGEIGISLVGDFFEPYTGSPEDRKATNRALDFYIGWFLDPLVFGAYPLSMRKLVKGRLPAFTAEESKSVKGSFDFMGFNYYTSRFIKAIRIDPNAPATSFSLDSFTSIQNSKDRVRIGKKVRLESVLQKPITVCSIKSVLNNENHSKGQRSLRMQVYPVGLKKLLVYAKRKYKIKKIYITENGIKSPKSGRRSIQPALEDTYRVDFILRHLDQIKQSISEGVNVKGYFHWSQFDSFEFAEGHQARYGLYYVDYNNNFTRIPKHSAKWLYTFLQDKHRTRAFEL